MTAISLPTLPTPARGLADVPDLALLERFGELRDESAFAEIVRRYAGVVYAACRRVLRDRSAAEDVAQETFLRLLRHPDGCSQSLGGWLHRSATRLAIDALRSETSRRRRESAHVPAGSKERTQSFAAPATAATELASWQELSPHVDAALDELPEPQRDLLVAHFLRGRSQVELAAEGNMSPATMSRRMRQSVDALRRGLSRRGVTLSVSALVVLCAQHAVEAAPAVLARELGKMAMVSGGGGWAVPATSASPPVDPTMHLRLAQACRAASNASVPLAPALRALAAYALAIAAISLGAFTSARWLATQQPAASPPARHFEQPPAPAHADARPTRVGSPIAPRPMN